ncbi:MAG: hypothetical protein OXQ96_02565, partial [Alphaproteobacteria bacterium]|nr:hypothetical protein [Alphaproteobacteria bacterium]
ASMQLQYISYYPAVFFQAIGGNGAGWGLYRYDIERNKLTFWNADAREISIDSNTGVITVNYVRHTPNGMGYLDDKVKFYHWPNNADQPVEFQP